MWKNRAAAPFNIVHLGYSCGAILANLLVRPFLHNSKSHVNVNISVQLNSTLSSSISVPLDADIRVPYMIAAGLCLLIGIGHLIFFIQEQKERQKKAQIKQVSLNLFVNCQLLLSGSFFR
jgi:fucose permease